MSETHNQSEPWAPLDPLKVEAYHCDALDGVALSRMARHRHVVKWSTAGTKTFVTAIIIETNALCNGHHYNL